MNNLHGHAVWRGHPVTLVDVKALFDSDVRDVTVQVEGYAATNTAPLAELSHLLIASDIEPPKYAISPLYVEWMHGEMRRLTRALADTAVVQQKLAEAITADLQELEQWAQSPSVWSCVTRIRGRLEAQ